MDLFIVNFDFSAATGYDRNMNFAKLALQAIDANRCDRALVYATLASARLDIEKVVAQAAVNFIQSPSPETFSELSEWVEDYVSES